MLRVTGLDHVVLNVADARRSLAWWHDLLGAEPVRLEEWEAGQAPFLSVRLDATTIIDLLETDRTGVNADHLCVVVEGADLDEVAASGRFEVVVRTAPALRRAGVGDRAVRAVTPTATRSSCARTRERDGGWIGWAGSGACGNVPHPGRIAQLVRALPSHGRGHRFESSRVHDCCEIDNDFVRSPLVRRRV